MSDPKQQEKLPKDVCIITIMFPSPDDDEAMNIKKEISGILKNIPEKRVTFQITNS